MAIVRVASCPQLKEVIPEVLLDYLYQLVQKEDTIQEIVLKSRELGAGTVQDIFCKTISGMTVYQVFGFEPVDTRLQISMKNNQIQLAIAG